MTHDPQADDREELPHESGPHRTIEQRGDVSILPRGTAGAVNAGLLEVTERSPIATAVIEAKDHLIRYANRAFRLLVTTNGPHILGTAMGDLLPAVDRELNGLLRSIHEHRLEEAHTQMRRETPEPDTLSAGWLVTCWPVTPAHRDAHTEYHVVQLCDLTADVDERARQASIVEELRHVNERLVLAALREQDLREKAQAGSVAKSDFLATMSHELRTPLAAIIGYEELLSDGITGPVTPAQRAQLARIKAAADHLLALIEEILTLSRVEARKEPLHLTTVRVADLLETTVAFVAPMAAAKGLTLEVHAAAGEDATPLTLCTDTVKLRQILLNLLGNAVKYSERGHITLTVCQRNDTVVFEVGDTGIGIPPEFHEQIFEVFWQVKQTATRTANGAGLGLSVSRRLARLLGGDITVESVVGEGSTFTLALPSLPPTIA